MKQTQSVFIHDLSARGSGVAYDTNQKIIFIPFTAPGDTVTIKNITQEKNYQFAQLVHIETSSKLRVSPLCSAFGVCGGCQWQHIPYALQWETKQKGVLQALKRVGLPFNAPIDTFPAKQIYGYRNRIQLRGIKNRIGYHYPGSNQLLAIQNCPIATQAIQEKWPDIQQQGSTKLKPYKVEVESFEDASVQITWNQKHASQGFRQIHDAQNQILKQWLFEQTQLLPAKVLLDLYGGNGNFSTHLHSLFQSVYCVDIVQKNTPLKSENIFFIPKSVPQFLQAFSCQQTVFAILDPPRIGLNKDFLEIYNAFERLQIKNFIHIGCDVTAWAADLKKWNQHGYHIQKIALFDFFPQTIHLECAALCSR